MPLARRATFPTIRRAVERSQGRRADVVITATGAEPQRQAGRVRLASLPPGAGPDAVVCFVVEDESGRATSYAIHRDSLREARWRPSLRARVLEAEHGGLGLRLRLARRGWLRASRSA